MKQSLLHTLRTLTCIVVTISGVGCVAHAQPAPESQPMLPCEVAATRTAPIHLFCTLRIGETARELCKNEGLAPNDHASLFRARVRFFLRDSSVLTGDVNSPQISEDSMASADPRHLFRACDEPLVALNREWPRLPGANANAVFLSASRSLLSSAPTAAQLCVVEPNRYLPNGRNIIAIVLDSSRVTTAALVQWDGQGGAATGRVLIDMISGSELPIVGEGQSIIDCRSLAASLRK